MSGLSRDLCTAGPLGYDIMPGKVSVREVKKIELKMAAEGARSPTSFDTCVLESNKVKV
jgi:hypothetical protein